MLARSVRRLAVGLMVSSLAISVVAQPLATLAADADQEVTATLDGQPIPLVDVGKYFCDDFAYPEIRCSRGRLLPEARATVVSLLAVDYVTIYDLANFGGAFMNVSQDYTVLATLGWNDRISSFKARNNETGTFYTDWFYGGGPWSFCCSGQAANLVGANNTFSSVRRT
jgi:hypothetical protein